MSNFNAEKVGQFYIVFSICNGCEVEAWVAKEKERFVSFAALQQPLSAFHSAQIFADCTFYLIIEKDQACLNKKSKVQSVIWLVRVPRQVMFCLEEEDICLTRLFCVCVCVSNNKLDMLLDGLESSMVQTLLRLK